MTTKEDFARIQAGFDMLPSPSMTELRVASIREVVRQEMAQLRADHDALKLAVESLMAERERANKLARDMNAAFLAASRKA